MSAWCRGGVVPGGNGYRDTVRTIVVPRGTAPGGCTVPYSGPYSGHTVPDSGPYSGVTVPDSGVTVPDSGFDRFSGNSMKIMKFIDF